MTYPYILLNRNNGHVNTYHPFTCEKPLTQEKITEMLKESPGSERLGANIYSLLSALDSKNIKADMFECPCCYSSITSFDESEIQQFINRTQILGYWWTIFEGISGNY